LIPLRFSLLYQWSPITRSLSTTILFSLLISDIPQQNKHIKQTRKQRKPISTLILLTNPSTTNSHLTTIERGAVHVIALNCILLRKKSFRMNKRLKLKPRINRLHHVIRTTLTLACKPNRERHFELLLVYEVGPQPFASRRFDVLDQQSLTRARNSTIILFSRLNRCVIEGRKHFRNKNTASCLYHTRNRKNCVSTFSSKTHAFDGFVSPRLTPASVTNV